MELDIIALFNGLILLIVAGIAGWLKNIGKKTDENRERIIRLEERARRNDFKKEHQRGSDDDNGSGYLD